MCLLRVSVTDIYAIYQPERRGKVQTGKKKEHAITDSSFLLIFLVNERRMTEKTALLSFCKPVTLAVDY